ncbi:MAG: bifunctional 3'-5' exonuclease/DNA polymerase [Actinobacteria bacterium]|nr:bifunctional 3'-5' exonuclease/DNA polymerase [Actinomycetota bacterium]MBU1609507.1 bifunctional 3'-5' exonuclease/DNA polymerase [Actinomycetota bacterium]MBU2315342.1 bifunctional 3'-5' exonuclease/DNA polymerase [Actinomycetota bacterium]MBU2385540.1 bifunctional 3'-5' exonuclease/DNA polymerase [Actinomycetota bacterium]
MPIVVERRGATVALVDVDDSGAARDDRASTLTTEAELPALVAEREAEHPRWVWTDTAQWYPPLLAAGVRVERCHDLRLVDRLLAGIEGRAPRTGWGAPAATRQRHGDTLFDLDSDLPSDLPSGPGSGPGHSVSGQDAPLAPPAVATYREHLAVIAAHPRARDLMLLAAAESVGALAAAEMTHVGLPWSESDHDALLTAVLGPRPPVGGRPARLDELAAEVTRRLGVGPVALDSPTELIRALRRAGLEVATTQQRELQRLAHPAIEPLLQYKSLARLWTANGWAWLDEWVHDGRFRPVFLPAGASSGRWASDGGGALQLPRQVRPAVRADEGWMLVVADAAQLEPRILAALSSDEAMARAGAGVDLYAGMVERGVVDSREHAKLGMLGAMYGGTTGESARVLPRLARSFPAAIAFVEAAARTGERGGSVTTHLGRTSPPPSAEWLDRQSHAAAEGASEGLRRAARTDARSWGRFTRNFVVQGTAAEWALAWLAGVRRRLWAAEGGPLEGQPHLAFFLHDELVVHAPAHRVSDVESALREAAAEAGRIVFGATPVTFPVTVAAVQRYSDAK